MIAAAIVAALAAAGPVWLCGCEKTTNDPDLASLEPDFNAIRDQMRNNKVESGVQKTGDKWTKFQFRPLATRFKLIHTASKKEPFQLIISIKYRLEMMSKPAETEALAAAAAYEPKDEFEAIVELVYSGDRWYLKRVDAQSLNVGPLTKAVIDDLLTKAVRRML
jgi:hypothetical protein